MYVIFCFDYVLLVFLSKKFVSLRRKRETNNIDQFSKCYCNFTLFSIDLPFAGDFI